MKNPKSLSPGIIRGVIYSSISNIISKVGALVFTIIIARMLFPELFGIYSLVLTIIITLTTLSDLGLGSAASRYISESVGNRNKIQARSRFQFLLKFKGIASLIIVFILFILSGTIAVLFKKPELALPLKIGSIYLLINSFYWTITPVFLSFQKLKYSAIAELIFQISRIVLVFIFLYFFKNVEVIFIALAISMIFSLIFAYIVLRKKFSFLIKGKIEPVERRRILKFSGYLTIGSIGAMIFGNIDKLILGYYVAAKLIGIYAAITTLIGAAFGILAFGGTVFLPAFTQLNGKRLERAFKKAFHYLSLIIIPSATGLAFLAIPLIRLLYGADYVPITIRSSMIITSALLSLLIIENAFTAIYAVLFNAREKTKITAILNITTSAITIILSIVFIILFIKINVDYSLIAVAIAAFIGRYIGLFATMYICRTKIKISPNIASIVKPLIASLFMLGYMFLFRNYIHLTVLTGIVLILTSMMVYFILIKGLKGLKFE